MSNTTNENPCSGQEITNLIKERHQKMTDLHGQINTSLDKVHEEIEKTGRFSVGEKLLFTRIHFKYDKDSNREIASNAHCFNPVRDELIKIEGVILTVKEHHKVRLDYDQKDATPTYDGYILLDEKTGELYNNQYPYASYGQTSDTANWTADLQDNLIFKTNEDGSFVKTDDDRYIPLNEREGYADLTDTLFYIGSVFDKCNISEDRCLLISEDVVNSLNEFKGIITNIIDTSGFEIQWKTIGKNNFKVSQIVLKGTEGSL